MNLTLIAYDETSEFEFGSANHEVSNFDKDDSNIIEADAEIQDDVQEGDGEDE